MPEDVETIIEAVKQKRRIVGKTASAISTWTDAELTHCESGLPRQTPAAEEGYQATVTRRVLFSTAVAKCGRRHRRA